MEGCEFGTIGFSTQRDANNHWRNRHQASTPATTKHSWVRHRDELQVLLFELTKAGDFETMQSLIANMDPPGGYWVDSVACHAILLAATKGSLPIVEILMDWCECWNTCWRENRVFKPEKKPLYSATMKGNNPELLLWCLEKIIFERHSVRDSYGWMAGEAIATGSPDMYAAWEDFFLDPDRGLIVAYPCYTGDPDALLNEALTRGKWSTRHHNSCSPPRFYRRETLQEYYRRSVLFSPSAFYAAKKSAIFEACLFQTWHKLINNVLGGQALDRRFLGCALVALARTSNPTTSLAAELLRLGAPIDFPRGPGSTLSKIEADKIVKVEEKPLFGPGGRRLAPQKAQKGMMALHHAARQTSEQASQFVRFLLEEGADPEYAYADIGPATEPGVALMKKWLGETWDAVVERTKDARLEKERLNRLKYGDSIDDSEGEYEDEVDSNTEEDDYEVDESEVDLAEARRRASEQRAERAAKRRRLD